MIYILPNAIPEGQTVFTVPNTVVSLATGQINQFASVNKVIIPPSVKAIDFRFFTSRIMEVEIDEGNNTYMSDGSAIYSKDGKTLHMYYQVSNDIKIKDEVTTVSGWAFISKANVKTLNIGKNVSTIGIDWRFTSVLANLTEVNIDKDNAKYKVEGNGIYRKDNNGDLDELQGVFGNIKEFEIPRGVKRIKGQAFYYRGLNKIIIPDTVHTIGAQAFENNQITEIRIPNSVKSMGDKAFASCINLTRIEIDNTKGSISGSPWTCPIGERAVVWLRE